ncbi:MAG: hypothetical protein JWO87_847 [Phycisphaerales bacterium]|nr:hypothetical protein [Phycisphaerales bacterium]
MTEGYQVLLTRNVFSRNPAGGMHPPRADGSDRPGGPGAPGGPGQAEAGLILRGAVRDNGAYIAFVEDANNHSARRVKEGELLAMGRVGHISLGGFDYESGGKVTRVALGHNLQGAAVPPPAPPAAAPPAGGPPKPPGPGGPQPPRPGGPPGPGGPVPVADSNAVPGDAAQQSSSPQTSPGS